MRIVHGRLANHCLTAIVMTVIVPFLLGVPRARAQTSPVGLWSLDGTTKATACAQGQCQSRRTSVHDLLSVDADGTFAYGLIRADECPDAPPIRGAWRLNRNGRTVLRGTNVRDWWEAVNACSGSGIVIRGRRFTGTMNVDRGKLRVLQPAHSTVQGIFVTVRIVGRFTITPAFGSASGAFVVAPSVSESTDPVALSVRALIDDVSRR